MTSYPGDYFSDDTQRFLAALSSSDFLGDYSSLQNASASQTDLPEDFGPLDFNSTFNMAQREGSSLFETSPVSSTTTPSSAASLKYPIPLNKPAQTAQVGAGTTSLRDISAQSVSPAESRETSPQFYKNADLEKRTVDDFSDDDLSETESKRQETAEPDDGKRKPGRKLMTAEPTSKRKAQNRAAQRAFRERKEKHLRDLESRVAELENESHFMTTENQFLKKQVDRLQSELKEYRKRQSVSVSAKSSPSSTHNYVTPFTFEFPLFGADTKAVAKDAKNGKAGSLFAPYSHASGHASSSTSSSTSNSPGLTATPPSASDSASDKKRSACAIPIRASSLYGAEETDFCAQLSMACGTRENPIPRAQSQGILSPPSFETDLFSDYREPIFNSAEEFTLPELTPDDMFDNLNDLNEPAITIKEEDEVVPADNKPLMGCTALWDRISMHPKFGDLDIDGLCSELRTKAKCSESGVVVTEADLNAVLKKIDTAV